MRRLLRALAFALQAFRYKWRNGDLARLSLAESREARLPTPKPVKIVAESVPFLIVQGDEECYRGPSGGEAKRCIEGLRAEGVEWVSFRDGARWDWGPR